ncbi:helix-turn-helix transcriptional regulator [Pectobacterium aroidearum]|jgi:putative transcriptional regulator|uniref:Transcriptional regulator, XRE family n=1 Tax=Pectobacterium carotovorum subsp. carotovorum (strain PC1) TaxID=561230 RepID=C6D9Y1_PECCP|nr:MULTISPECIES: helix-turn-helix transcriptional regulator [Pectobacterium]ACT13737.1 transcriptional regulator, XRE family [Pectobacterium carotovorum subsp. carotovorum PC1]MBA5600926.1 helix-turn-helix transcriptional regulator [Pectobacterium aroidearum]MDY4388633.1 helix-turn-helix transcriptional regulator [Pectobacterium aroidearum]WKA61121.1 helix-turn-helix transcriptional regulator [Pectobacterium aroidearum]
MAVEVHLDKLLVEKKMTSRALAAFVGITEQNLSLLKSGKVKGIRFDTLAKICEALQCQPGDIISWKPDSPPAVSDDTL